MFKISRRQTILRASLLGCLVVAVLSTAAYFIINQQDNTNAITQTGVKVDVTLPDDSAYHYGTHMTHHYHVIAPSDEVTAPVHNDYDGYCAEPAASDPTGEEKKAHMLSAPYASDSGAFWVNKIKLIIFLREHKNDSSISNEYNSIFNQVKDSDYWGTSESRRIYAFTHAVIGVLYSRHKGTDDDTSGLNSTWISRIDDVIDQLQTYIADPTNVAWQKATTFALLRTGGTSKQDVVWIEPTGSIVVRKCDSEIYNLSGQATCTSQSTTSSLAGITFTLKQGNTTIATQTLSGNTNQVVFRGLDLNTTYTVVEGNSNNTVYNVTATSQSATLPNSATTSQTATLTFTNTIKRGKLTINKKDADIPTTQACSTAITKGLSFTGITFELYHTSDASIVYNNTIHAPSATQPFASKSIAEGECSVSFDNLPYGTYSIVEKIPSNIKGWVTDETPRTITIPNGNETEVTYTFENQPVRGNLKFVKKDPNNNTVLPNSIFEITSISNNYTESHIVVADENGIVDTGANRHSFNTNGYDEPYYNFKEDEINLPYAGYGTWFGIDNNNQPIPVKDSVGALPYGSYLIQEKRCDQFKFCRNVNNEKKVFSITEHGETVLLDGTGEWNNDCAEFTLATTATDNSDGDHYIEVGQETAIKDVVNYCAKAGFTFTIKGTLMDKATNQPLLVNGEPIEQSVEVSPTDSDCGTVEMLFPINTADLAGKSVVVFEKLYYKNELKTAHEDINDEGQTVDIVSLGTVAVDNSDEDKLIVPNEETVIKDTVSYCAPAGKPYTITGVLMDKTTGSAILINEEPVTQSVTFTPEQNCGTVELIFPAIDTTAIAGHPIVAYETLYKVVPGEPGEPDTKEPILPHEDPNDPDQTVYVIDLYTTVKPNEDGTKVFPRDTDVTVTDTVHYCLQPGLEYTVKGIVMDRDTGNGLLVNSAPVEQTATFTPTETCGNFDMTYSFNTTDLGGARLVIFESLYYNDELLIEHKDIDNELESFEIDINVPETGFATRNHNGGQESSHQELIVIAIIATVPVIAYSLNRYRVRKSFLKR